MKFLLIVAFLISMPTFAQQQLIVSTGGSGGAYFPMVNELAQACSSSLLVVNRQSSGCEENLNNLLGNKVNAVMCQADAIFARSQQQNVAHVKTLLAMHPEEVHLVALRGAGTRQGFISSLVPYRGLEDFTGKNIGAAGGSVTSAKIIRLQSEVAFNLTEFKSNAELLEGLKSRKVDGAILVGGAPMSIVEELSGADFTLVPFSQNTVSRLKNVYSPARLHYANLNANVTTIATDALLLTREYKSPEMIQALANFRACAFAAIPKLQDLTGTHPKWQLVDVNKKGTWQWYDLPKGNASMTAASSIETFEMAKEKKEAAEKAIKNATVRK